MTALRLADAPACERARTFADLHFYQKWRAVWPRLAKFPREGIRLLDAGCGDGAWTAEIARRRPGWTLTGIDRDQDAIARARARPLASGHAPMSFECADFLTFTPPTAFDIVLSICATHYGPTLLDTQALFRCIRTWLSPSGHVLLLVPRCVEEAPFVRTFKTPRWHTVFSREGLADLCRDSGLTPETLTPCIGPWGTMAKQMDWSRSETSAAAGRVIGAIARSVAIVDAHVPQCPTRSLMWLLVARPRVETP